MPPVINAPLPIDPKVATDMYLLYNIQFNPGMRTATNVAFDLPLMQEMLQSFSEAGATHVRVYFGAQAEKDDDLPAYIQTNVFFQAAVANPAGTDALEDLPFETIHPYDVGFPCPPPRCPGKSNYPI